MPDFGQYTEDEFYGKLKEGFDRGDPRGCACERCGATTKTGTIFGMVLCNDCWNEQTGKS